MRALAFALLIAIAAIAWLVVETRQLAEVAGGFEVAARSARAEADRLRAAPPPTAPTPSAANPAVPAAQEQSPAAYAQMALELQSTRQQLANVTALLEQRNQEARQRAEAAAAAAAKAARPMPEGVRECLIALHECLRADGYFGPRFLHAARVGAQGLEEVEMLDGDSAGLDVAVITAGRVTATLDRAHSRFELRFFDGERSVRGERTALPKDGFALAFADVDGPRFEARLPYLVRAEGVYPEPTEPRAKAVGELDPVARRQWLERLERVLAAADLKPAWRVNRLRGLADAWFRDGELVSTDDKHLVVGGAHCARFAIEIDEAAGLVSLRMCDGVLHRGAIESSITGEGMRILLPGLQPRQASDLMFGMVVKK